MMAGRPADRLRSSSCADGMRAENFASELTAAGALLSWPGCDLAVAILPHGDRYSSTTVHRRMVQACRGPHLGSSAAGRRYRPGLPADNWSFFNNRWRPGGPVAQS